MTRFRSSWIAPLVLAALAVARGQTPLGADVEIFGADPVEEKRAPDVVKPAANLLLNIFGAKRISSSSSTPKTPKVEGMEHTLLFTDGRQMRGRMVELTANEVVWSRIDVNQPLRFGRKDIRRVSLRGPVSSSDNDFVMQQAGTSKKSEPTSMATVKLGGTDWMHGEVSSADGQTYSVKLPGSTSFTVTREQIGWMFFGKEAVAGFGLDFANVEAWTISGSPAEDLKDGRIKFPKNAFVAKSMKPPKRFEVAFEIPVAKAEEAAFQLWLQPFSPRPNSYSTGTVQLSIGESEMERCIYENGFKRDKVKLPADAPAAKDGWHRVRVFYDGVDRKLTVMRNGAKAAEWALADDKVNGRETLRGLCFNRENMGDVVVGNFRLLPWDGNLAETEQPADTDRLSLPSTPTETGRTTAISEKKITFGGVEKDLMSGTMLRFSDTGKGMADADALLVFGQNGELSAGGLEIREGRAKFRTSFSPSLELETTSLQTIAFPSKSSEAAVSDVLVFKNADELPGKLVETINGGVLKWKTPAGFDVEIQPDRVAGVRFGVKPHPPSAPPGARVAVREVKKDEEKEEEPAKPKHSTLELRNGDRVAGELVAIGKDTLKFKHALAGERDIAGAQAWSYYTSPVIDGASDWGQNDPDYGGRRTSTLDRWIALDGAFFTRTSAGGSAFNDNSYLTQTGLPLPQRYEIRCSARVFGNSEPYFTISLTSKNGNNQLNLSFSYGELNIHGYSQRGNGRSFSTEVPLRGKFGQSSQRSVRLLVDREKGTLAVLMDGVLLKKLGTRKEDTFVNLGHTISFSSYSGYSATKLSNFWIGPWNGEMPGTGATDGGAIALANGDVAAGKVLGLRDGKMAVETDVGEFELPMDRIAGVEFGGAPSPAKAAGRIRLKDGSIFHVDEFRWEAGALTAKSAALGDLKFAAADVSELILAPQPIRFPTAPSSPKAEEKPKPAEAAAPAVPLEPAQAVPNL
ncbi:MAG: hypothetical protein RL088_4297 [Verrucomicrobiota bacterium]